MERLGWAGIPSIWGFFSCAQALLAEQNDRFVRRFSVPIQHIHFLVIKEDWNPKINAFQNPAIRLLLRENFDAFDKALHELFSLSICKFIIKLVEADKILIDIIAANSLASDV